MSAKIVFSKKYSVKGLEHVFRADKFEAALNLLLKEKVIRREDILEPVPPSAADLELAHDRIWVEKVLSGNLSAAEQVRAEFPVTRELALAHVLHVGGTMKAAELALRSGLGINCGGGAHHAFADHGEGFCLLNDIAVAVRKLQKRKKIRRALIVDLDVHQGNGTASIFRNDGTVFTFSMHQRDAYPAAKETSSLDVELPRAAGDARYLGLLEKHLSAAFKKAGPDLVIYNAGVDVYERDLLGGLKMTMTGIEMRDRFVFGICRKFGVPAALVLSGGYAAKFSDTARLHANTMKAAILTK